MNTAATKTVKLATDDQFLYRPRVERIGNRDEVVYDIFRMTATRSHEHGQFMYDEQLIVTMDDPIQVNRMMEFLSTPSMMTKSAALILEMAYFGGVDAKRIGIVVRGNATSLEILCRTVSTYWPEGNLRSQLRNLCAYLNGVPADIGKYYTRPFRHVGIVHNDACMVISPQHEKVAIFTDIGGQDPVSKAKAIAELLNKPVKGSYSMVPIWGDGSQAVILIRLLDGIELVAYPIMSTFECREVISIIKTHEE